MNNSILDEVFGWILLGIGYLIVKGVIWVTCGVGEWFQWLGDKF